MRDEYQLFARVVELGSLSAAARSLKVSPAMVSKNLVRLEERLGARLLHRTTRHVALTDAGEEFYARIVPILAAAAEAEAAVGERTGLLSGMLHVSSAVQVGREHISPVLGSFLDRYPGVSLRFDLDDAFVDMRMARIDVAIRITGVVEDYLAAHLLAPNNRILCGAPAYFARRGEPQTIDDLAGHDLLGADFQFPWRLEGPAGEIMIEGDGRARSNSSEVVRDFLRGGHGIALRSEWDVAEDLRRGTLRRILPEYRGASNVGIHAVHRKDPFLKPAIPAFIRHISTVFAGDFPLRGPFRGV